MISNVYSVYDAKLKAYGRPWFEMTKGSAIRLFTDAVNDASPNNQWNKHPEDFSCIRFLCMMMRRDLF